MVAPLLRVRPMSIAVATGLVAGGAFTSYTTVYADEYNRNDEREHDRRQHHGGPYDNDDEDTRVMRYRPTPAEHHRISNRHSLVANEEELLPGLLYVALAGLSGSLVARQRNILFRMFSPLAFAAAAGAYVLPNTTHTIIDSIGGPMSAPCPQHPDGFSKPGWAHPTSSSSHSPVTGAVGEKAMGGKSELSSRARDAWHPEGAVDSAREGLEEGAERAKRWWGERSGDARDAMEDVRDSAGRRLRDAQEGVENYLDHDGVGGGGHRRTVSDSDSRWFHRTDDDEADKAARKTRYWLNSKSSEAEDAAENAKGRARTAQRDAQRWGDEKYSEAEEAIGDVKGRARNAQRDAKRWGDEKYSEAESKLHDAEGKAKEVSKEAKSWWFSRSSDVEEKAHEVGDKAKEMSKDAEHWWNRHSSDVEEKVQEVEDKAKEVADKAKDATKEAKHWWNKHAPEVEDKLHEAEAKAKDATKEVKHWWNKHAPEVEEKIQEATAKAKDVSKQASATIVTAADKSKDTLLDLKDKSKDAKNWIEEKAHEAEKVAEDVAHKAEDVAHKAKALVDETTATIDKKLEETAKKDEEWWKAHAEVEEKKLKERLAKEKKDAEKHWFSSRRTRSAVGPDLDSTERWSTGEEMGSAKIHENDFDHRYRNPGPFHSAASTTSAYTSSDSYMDGLLDDNEVDHWTSTKEEIGSSRLEGTSPTSYHTYGTSNIAGGNDYELYGFRPRESEYWSNGEEMSSASVRDSTYYNYPGSFAGSSIGRTSWWSARRAEIDHDSEMNNLRDKAEAIIWETKQAAEHAALDMANKLAAETAMLEKSAAATRARAEEAARLAKAQSEALLRDRQAAIDRAAKEMETRFAMEKEAAERSAAETKAKAQAWELEQRQWAEQSAKDVQDRVLREKLAAEESAARLKARAEAWAQEQKERAEAAAKEIHDRVVHETAAAERAAREAKAALELKIQQEKLKVEQTAREIQERIRLEKIKEEETQANLRARAEALAREEKIKMENAAREWEERLSLERAQKAAEEARIRMEAELLAKKRAAEKAAQDFVQKKKMDVEKAARELEMRIKREKEEALVERAQADALEAKRLAEAAGLEKRHHAELAAKELEYMKEIERAEAAAREAHDRAEALLREKRPIVDRVSNEVEQRLSFEKAEAAALAAKSRAEALLAETRRAAGRPAKDLADSTVYPTTTTASSSSGSGWSWPWSSKPHGTEVLTEKVSTKEAKHTHDHESGEGGFDSTPHLLEHIVEDIKQTKDDISDGLHHLKDSVLSGIPKSSANTKESVKETRFTPSSSSSPSANEAKPTVEKAAMDAKGWWGHRTKDAERKVHGLESELHSGLNKTGEKLKEMGQEAAESDAEFWQKKAQQERRESGRAM
ncbi:hypothetical protein KI688_010339 [Linnemannia hyalina]|uniref:MICOS complex subunit n=1 Tax=Linnemannia hyalina TaxID=64524 RepID=A0A9P7XYG0_9FUNG|nr:hypothetical protein KI688_010339 [Linnemannia hyalina]